MDKNAMYALGGVVLLGGILLIKKKPAPSPGNLTVHFISNPSGAAVSLDGVSIGPAPFDLDVSYGDHLAVFSLTGYVDAIVSFTLTLGMPPFTLTANMTAVTPPPPNAVTVNFVSNPTGAAVILDGSIVGTTPISLDIAFGQHTAIFRLTGYLDTTMSLTLTQGMQPFTLTANLTPVVVKVGVAFSTNPAGASIFINDSLLGTTPQSISLNLGTYTVRFTKSGYEDWTTTLTIDGSFSSITVGAILTPIPPPATPVLTLILDSAERYVAYTFNYPHILARAENRTNQQITGRTVYLFRRYTSPTTGLPIEQNEWLGDPLKLYGTPQSASYPEFTLAPGGITAIDFIGWVDLPRDRLCEVWLQDATTGGKSNVISL